MATIESKRFISPAQPGARKKHSTTSPQPSAPGPSGRSRPHRSPKNQKKRQRLPASLRFTETKRGKTTIRRYDGRTFYRLEEVRGKIVDFVELFLCADSHSIDVRFDDKTSLYFLIEPGFTLETEHADWKTGNWRPIKRWPLIHSESHRVRD